jgi:cytochrome c-type biogenesis protein CcmF
MNFEGEHLLPGKIGHFFVLLAFTASLLSTFSYFKTSTLKDPFLQRSWLRFSRLAFLVQGISILTVFGVIYYICSQHYFEYMYAYKHASLELEPKYLLACIWEGQEGSFLLWSIWHAILGAFIIFRGKEWEAPVMSAINLAQCFLMTMILGLYFFDVRIGSSAFVLTRNEIDAPIFSRPDYLSLIRDGVGLNVLLRNYWMVIHPPVLFMGFASTIVPVGFAYAGLLKKQWGAWIKPALPWALFSAAVLGVGIMMGGKWAYESLSFGGYWAWDPVENASLVPWLILVAGLHCMVIYNATGTSLRASYVFIILTNAFVLYSTFLTRTGILGDSSVHSFTEAGTATNILIGLFGIAVPLPVMIYFLVRQSKMPKEEKEEHMSGREFWMFIGSLILFLSSMFIIAVTSVPVINKFFHTSIADPEDREFTYNKIMVLVAVVVGILSATGQYFKYRRTERELFLKRMLLPFVATVVVTGLIIFLYPIEYTKQGVGFLIALYAALFACLFSAFANAAYIKTVLHGNMKAAGGAVAHTGFAIMIVGMIISAGNKQVISDNRKTGIFMPFDQNGKGKASEDPMENLTLLKNIPTQMGTYRLTYTGDSAASEKNRSFYKLAAEKVSNSGKVTEHFVLQPDVYKMKDNNLSSNPDIKHYLTHDVFTYVSSLPNKEGIKDTASFKVHEVKMLDTIFYSKGFIVLNSIEKNPSVGQLHFKPEDTALVATLTVFNKDSTSHKSYPYLSIKDQEVNIHDDTVYASSIYTRFAGIANDGKFKIAVKESDMPIDFVTLKAYVFPYINLVWAGLIIMALGILMSLMYRIKAGQLRFVILLAVVAALSYMFFLAN